MYPNQARRRWRRATPPALLAACLLGGALGLSAAAPASAAPAPAAPASAAPAAPPPTVQQTAANSEQTPPQPGAPTRRAAVKQDVSAPLRDLPVAPPDTSGAAPETRPVPLDPTKRQVKPAPAAPQAPTPNGTPSPMPTPGNNYAGIDNPNGYYPPDTNGDVGPHEYVQIVNASFAVYEKDTGQALYGPVNNNTLWGGFGGSCQLNNDGDPIVQYDGLANRWLISQFAVSGTSEPDAPVGAQGTFNPETFECVAVSATEDPLGPYYRYAFSYGTDFPDYPKIGVWPDGYYVTYNTFGETSYLGATTCALERRAMLVGAPAFQMCFTNPDAYSLLPADVDGPTPPPVGSPNYVMGLARWNNYELQMYRFHADWDNPSLTTLSGPENITINPVTKACELVGRGRCVPQPGTAVMLESLGARTMYRLAYRNFGDHESLITNQTIAPDDNGGLTSQTGIEWYEIRSPGTTPTLFQEGLVVSPDPTEFRWMASMAMDSQGNIGMGYSTSSTTQFPSINYIGRLAGDPQGTMPYEQGTIQTGSGSQTGSAARWGDYTNTSVDPLDDCTFWHTNEYLQTTSERGWSTRIASFKFPGCNTTTSVASAPQNVTTARGLGQIPVSWTAPANNGGLPITGYTVVANPGGATCTTVVGADLNPLTCTVPGLTDGQSYEFSVVAHNGQGDSPAGTAPALATPGSALVTVPPVRIADTRPGPVPFPITKAKLPAGATLEVPVAGANAVPADAPAASLNVAAVAPDGDGHLTVFPCGSGRPDTSNVNFTTGRNSASAVLTQIGTLGHVCVYTSTTTDVMVDLNGWFPLTAGYTSLSPQRVADTRVGEPVAQPPVKAPVPAGGTLPVTIAGSFSVPADAGAVALTVTAVKPVGAGHVTVYPCGESAPLASNINFADGQTTPNAVLVRVGAGGQVCVNTSSTADILVDLDGWMAQPPGYTAQAPVRIADSRPGEPVAFPFPKGPIPAGTTVEIPLGGFFGVPADVSAATLNVTATQPDAAGHLRVFPCGSPLPTTSSLNFSAGQTVANAALTAVGSGGKVCVYTGATTQLIVDLNGWYPHVNS